MLSGVRFNSLEYGEPLANKNWSYKNLWGLYAVKEKLKDQFNYAEDIGFNMIYDSINIYRDEKGKLTINRNKDYDKIWPIYDPINHDDIISFYKKSIYGRFKFICEIKFPEDLNEDNLQEYYDFFIDIIKSKDFGWIENWQILNYPEENIFNKQQNRYEVKVNPNTYIKFISKIRTSCKLLNPNINIGGPGLFKGLAGLLPDNYLNNDKSFDSNWIITAINNGLLQNIDFLTIRLQQDVKGLNYDEINKLCSILKNIILEKNEKSIPIISLNQGRQVLNNSYDNLNNQAYYNVSEFLNSAKNNVIPIVNSMVDICNDKNLIPDYVSNINEEGYGICKYDLTKKPQYEVFKFVLQSLKDFYALSSPIKLYDNNNLNIDSISFISNNKEDILSIVWPKYGLDETVVILPNTDEWYYLITGEKNKIISPLQFRFLNDETKKINFLIVKQHLNLKLIDYEELNSNIFKKYIYHTNIRNSLLNSVPIDYNVYSENTNFYKILRSYTFDMADTKIELDILKDNMYLETAHKDAIYKNFGYLVDLEKNAKWDYEKYRKLVQGVIESLLTGPTLPSIEKAINLFINYESIYDESADNYEVNKIANVKIHELYKKDNFLDPSAYLNLLIPQFSFLVEVNKNIKTKIDQDYLNKSLKYIINILKPAHTLAFILITLSGSEDYKKYFAKYKPFGIEFKDSDEYYTKFDWGSFDNNDGIQEGTYGWKHVSYTGNLRTHNIDLNNNNSLLNGGIPIGPRYVLNDEVSTNTAINSEEITDIKNKIEEESANVLRYGYYDSEHDRNDIDDKKRDNQVKKELIRDIDGHTYLNPDYHNPDSGEYYKNWWLKYHKVQKNLNNKNLEENKSFDYNLISDVKLVNTNVEIFDKLYKDKKYKYKKVPVVFETTASVNKEYNCVLLNSPISNESSSYNDRFIKYNTGVLGVPFKKLDNNLPLEIKPWEHSVKIDDDNNVEIGNMPYNNINHRLFIRDYYPYNGKDSNLYFENMDMTPNYKVEFMNEIRFGYNPFIFTTNISNLTTNISPKNDLVGYGHSKLDDTYNVSMEICEKDNFECYQQKFGIFKLNVSRLSCIEDKVLTSLPESILKDTKFEMDYTREENIDIVKEETFKNNTEINNKEKFEKPTTILSIESNESEKFNCYQQEFNIFKLNVSKLSCIEDKALTSLPESVLKDTEFKMDYIKEEKVNIIKEETFDNIEAEMDEKFNCYQQKFNIFKLNVSKLSCIEDKALTSLPESVLKDTKFEMNYMKEDKVNIIKEETINNIKTELNDKFNKISNDLDIDLSLSDKFNKISNKIDIDMKTELNDKFNKVSSNLDIDAKIELNDKFNKVSNKLDIEVSLNEKFIVKEPHINYFKLNCSKINTEPLLSNLKMAACMEMYKIKNGKKVIMKESTMVL